MRISADLPQIIANEIRAEWVATSGPRVTEVVINTVTDRLACIDDVHSDANWRWALRSCVRSIHNGLLKAKRPKASDIEEREQYSEDARVLPGFEELRDWPIKLGDGTVIHAADATLAQADFGAADYLRRGRENTTKGRYLLAVTDAMRARGFRAEQTVEEFYRSAAA